MAPKFRDTCGGGCGTPRFVGSPDFGFYGPNVKGRKLGIPYDRCKECQVKRRREWIDLNPEKYKNRWLSKHLLDSYGLSIFQYRTLLVENGGRCAICRDFESRHRELSLDHDHKSGELRGFLCSKCNLMLGNARDNPKILLQAAFYLKRARLSIPEDDSDI